MKDITRDINCVFMINMSLLSIRIETYSGGRLLLCERVNARKRAVEKVLKHCPTARR